MTEMRDHDQLERLIKENFEEVQMEAAYRQSLLDQTRSTVAQRRHSRHSNHVLLFAAGMAILIMIFMLLNYTSWAPKFNPQPEGKNNIQAIVPGPVKDDSKVQQKKDNKKQEIKKKDTFLAAEKKNKPTGFKQITSKNLTQKSIDKKNTPLPMIASGDKLVVISSISDSFDNNGRRIQYGDRLSIGSVIKTSHNGRLTLLTRQGSQIYLASDTVYTILSGNSSKIDKGRIYLINRNHEIKRINTTAGDIQLLGTTIDTAVIKKDIVAVTVVSGQVKLQNNHGESTVNAGKRSILMASAIPDEGDTVNIAKETAWFDGRGMTVSEFGKIAYTVRRQDSPISEVWTMNADGTDKQKVMSYLGFLNNPGPWMPGDQWLSISAYSALWSTPDILMRRASAGAGHPIIKEPSYLLNAATAQDMIFELPKGYDPLYPAISPDGRYMAFTGSYKKDETSNEGGLWVFDSVTGDIDKLLDGWIKTPPAWAPDGKHIAVSEGEGYGTNHPLALIDTKTGDIQRISIQGAGPVISPDGTKIAYCGDFKQGGSWYRGVPMSGSIFVVDIKPDSTPIRLSPEGEGSIQPSWSPDGTRIMYNTQQFEWDKTDKNGMYIQHYQIYIANADGSGTRLVYKDDKRLESANWSNDGNAVFIRTSDSILIVNTDGSGLIKNLGGSESDSILSPEEKLQSEQANKAVQDAIFQYAMGNIRIFEGKPKAARTAFMTASRIFAETPWRYPLARLSVINMQAYADSTYEKTLTSDDEYLTDGCRQHMSFIEGPLMGYLKYEQFTNGIAKFPSDLKIIVDSAIEHGGGTNWLFYKNDPTHSMMMLTCPGTTIKKPCKYIYTPIDVEKMKVGDMIISCPNHPENKMIVDDSFIRRLNRN